jgi:hypothetical protein
MFVATGREMWRAVALGDRRSPLWPPNKYLDGFGGLSALT